MFVCLLSWISFKHHSTINICRQVPHKNVPSSCLLALGTSLSLKSLHRMLYHQDIVTMTDLQLTFWSVEIKRHNRLYSHWSFSDIAVFSVNPQVCNLHHFPSMWRSFNISCRTGLLFPQFLWEQFEKGWLLRLRKKSVLEALLLDALLAYTISDKKLTLVPIFFLSRQWRCISILACCPAKYLLPKIYCFWISGSFQRGQAKDKCNLGKLVIACVDKSYGKCLWGGFVQLLQYNVHK